jgi:hypothetical protein
LDANILGLYVAVAVRLEFGAANAYEKPVVKAPTGVLRADEVYGRLFGFLLC